MYYSQKDKLWEKIQLGDCKGTTIGSAGCKVCSVANLLLEFGIKKTPIEINDTLRDKKLYKNGCEIVDKTIEIFDIKFIQRTTEKPDFTCIMETDHYKNLGVKQHFVLFRDDEIVDPLDLKPEWKKNIYKAVSYRIFAQEVKGEDMLIDELNKKNKEAEQAKIELERKAKEFEEAKALSQKREEEAQRVINSLVEEKAKLAPLVETQSTLIKSLMEKPQELQWQISTLEDRMSQNLISSRVKSLFWRLASVGAVALLTYLANSGYSIETKAAFTIVMGAIVGELTKYISNTINDPLNIK